MNNNARAHNFRDWSLFADGTTPVSYNPLDTFRISSCSIETVDNLVKSIQMTASQGTHVDGVPPTKKKKVIRKKKETEVVTEEGVLPKPKKKVVKKVVKKKKPIAFIKKLEVAGQCTLHGLTFLQVMICLNISKLRNKPEFWIFCRVSHFSACQKLFLSTF